MVRIWACDHPDQRMKKEEPYYMLGGKVLDLAWNGESNRLAVVGEGQPPAKARHFLDTS